MKYSLTSTCIDIWKLVCRNDPPKTEMPTRFPKNHISFVGKNKDFTDIQTL